MESNPISRTLKNIPTYGVCDADLRQTAQIVCTCRDATAGTRVFARSGPQGRARADRGTDGEHGRVDATAQPARFPRVGPIGAGRLPATGATGDAAVFQS